jgi:tetratricopeptide (TPR) repeat protein
LSTVARRVIPALVCLGLALGQSCFGAVAAAISSVSALDELQTQIIRYGVSKETFDRLEQIIKTEPRNAKAHYVLGLALKKLGYTDLAAEQFRLVSDCDPKYASVMVMEFRDRMNKEDLLSAVEHAPFVRNIAPNCGALMYLNGLMLRDEENFGEAAAAFSGAMHRDPGLLGPASGLGSIYVVRHDYQRAKALAYVDVSRNNRHHQGNVVIGEALIGLHQYAEAQGPLQISFDTQPTWPGTGRLLAEDLLDQGKGKEALVPCLVDMACESKAARLEQVKLLAKQILVHVNSLELANAIKQADQIVKGTDYQPRLYFALGDVLDRGGQYLNAAVVRKEGLLKEPNYTRGYYREARSLQQCRNYDDAIRFFQKAYEHDPRNEEYRLSYFRAKERRDCRENDLAWRLKDWWQKLTCPQTGPMQLGAAPVSRAG